MRALWSSCQLNHPNLTFSQLKHELCRRLSYVFSTLTRFLNSLCDINHSNAMLLEPIITAVRVAYIAEHAALGKPIRGR